MHFLETKTNAVINFPIFIFCISSKRMISFFLSFFFNKSGNYHFCP
jgi:hypothetical protein